MGIVGGAGGTALILAGAVAKGAFEAGALSVIVEKGFNITRIVGASAGSLNGAVLAAGIRRGEPRAAVERLVGLWRDRADWRGVFDPSLRDLVGLRGASTMDKVRPLLREAMEGGQAGERRPIDLSLVLTVLRGCEGAIGSMPATTFEGVAKFSGDAFDTPEGRAKVCDAAVASASFPAVFEPAVVAGFGPCLDGGIVNNTPVKWAIDGSVERIVVVTAKPPIVEPPESTDGPNPLGELVDILVDERLYRDLHEAESVNERLRELDALVDAGRLTRDGRDAVASAFRWRRLEIIQIRPEAPLSGNAFSGFFHGNKREEYIEAGVKAARRILE